MSWRLAKSLEQLRREVNAAHPGRPTGSDGTIGDAKHRARKSAHNPDELGVVRAWDVTGPVGHQLAEWLRERRDPRIYICISNGRIFSAYNHSGGPAWSWRPYSGSNPHETHAHIQVDDSKHLYDDDQPWGYHDQGDEDVVRRGDKGPHVAHFQHRLNVAGYDAGTVDGSFGPGTEAAVNRLKKSGGLVENGIIDLAAVDLLRERLEQARERADHSHDDRYARHDHGHTGVVSVQ